jgi:hypothetical protein
LSQTARLSSVNVIDAFHNVNQAEVRVRFIVDERATRGGINMNDELLTLREDFQYGNLKQEVEGMAAGSPRRENVSRILWRMSSPCPAKARLASAR